jgi:hypothetical protein
MEDQIIYSGDMNRPIGVILADGHAMAQAVSRRSPTAEARVGPFGICGGQSGTGTGFFPEYFGFPLSISFHRCYIT